jgi:large subunit ribosomal protein L29
MNMTVKEIREKETGHLTEELAERRKHLFDLRSQAVTEKLEDPSQLRKTRKEIAQMKTILRQREIEAQPKREKAAPAKAAEKTPTVKKSTVKKSAAKRKTTAATAE